jgi:hypothetical protein
MLEVTGFYFFQHTSHPPTELHTQGMGGDASLDLEDSATHTTSKPDTLFVTAKLSPLKHGFF